MRNWLMCIAMAALCGCGGSSKVSLSARAGALTQNLTLANGISVTRVRLVIATLKLEPADGNEGEDEDDKEIEAGPFLVDLEGAALDGGIRRVFDADVPDGEYKQVKFRIHKLSEENKPADPAFADLVAAKASILVDGTIDGAAFTFASSLDEEQERESKVSIGADGENLTLNIDPAGWFTGSAGRLDPRVGDNRSAIESAIKKSIDVYEDDDEDGHEDD